ncbi:tRNA pseudouridine(55) synthase TruB [Tamilnaduibacter salinus]|uniref:tRNA pseudouridine synthase B n=1 Tax=Tamilnaduibacter salinus TaxID=1484056 RepID=A0A2A2I6R5_9GAMM|nr:tRNA pseudouridine(55) synthase TruB [Tamilnaduibacter salinus]PAV26820.1 tRNA pseudouridine(55) synthase TruB [Tamilnaduibacter salinus]
MSRRRKGRPVNGLLVVDKPAGMTSNKLLQAVRHLLGAAKAGHTGALDPLATGVLPLCFGEATKFSQWMLDSDKGYLARARLGVTTETGDSDGEVVSTDPVPELDEDRLESVLASFRGEIEQIPSMYSALKHNGRPLYEYAREGIDVERPPRPVTIRELVLESQGADEFEIRVTCTKGTYIRTLVEDIGQALGCGAHVTALRRTLAAGYTLEQAMPLEELVRRREGGESLDPLLYPVESALAGCPAITLDDDESRSILNGQAVRMKSQSGTGSVRLYHGAERFLGLGEVTPAGEVAPRRLVRQD